MSRIRPCCSACSTTREAISGAGSFVAGSRTNSIPIIDPRPRTSPICGTARSASPGVAAGLADRARAAAQVQALDLIEHGERGLAGNRVADVRAADGRVARRVHDRGPAEHAREREAAGDRLGDADQVGLDARLLDREERAGAAEARSAPRRRSARSRTRRRSRAGRACRRACAGTKPPSPCMRLDDDGGDGLRRDARDQRLAQVVERLGRGVARARAVLVRERDAVDLGRERSEPRLVRVHASTSATWPSACGRGTRLRRR